MAPKKKTLYTVKPAEMPFGVVPGAHIPCMFDKKANLIKNFVPLKKNEVPQINSGYDPVGQEELFHNSSEFVTENTFRVLASMSENDYQRYQSTDSDMEKFLFGVKDYITAPGRSSQQKALISLKIRMYNCKVKYEKQLEDYNNKGNLSQAEEAEKVLVEQKIRTLLSYAEHLVGKTRGSMEVPEDQKVMPDQITEPEHVFLGKLSHWESSNDALFPHEPSPNDIKQGAGLQDCFVLSVLIQMADTNPDYIKNMMRDNGNGTVSVRFYKEAPKKKDAKKDDPVVKEPVYITVKKTVAKLPLGHNVYASSSLWVQMVEKAFAKYTEQYGQSYANPKPGMGGIWRNFSEEFMNAILPTENSSVFLPHLHETMLYDKNGKGEFINHPDHYMKDEEAVYNGLKKYVNDKKETMTVMPDRRFLFAKENPHDEGLRNGHIYAIRKVFEKDGKKFVQLRDPYACFNPRYDGATLTKSNLDVIKGTIYGGIETMGTFNLELKDFMRHFNQFSGMSKEAAEEFRDILDRGRSYQMAPVTKEEMASDSPLPLDDDIEQTQRDYTRIDNIRNGKRVYYANRLVGDSDAMAALSKQIDEIVKDLKSTDEFFVFTNTRNFNAMRDHLYDFNKQLKDHVSGKKKLTGDELFDKLGDLGRDSAEYMKSKENSMSRTMAKGNKVSDRAFIRYTAALNLNCVTHFEPPLCNWPSKKSESLNVLKGDIEDTLARAEARLDSADESLHSAKAKAFTKEEIAQLQYARRMLEKVNDMIEQNRNVKNGSRKELRQISEKTAKAMGPLK